MKNYFSNARNYGAALAPKQILDLLNKENLFYYQKIEERYIITISKIKYDAWQLNLRSEYDKNYFQAKCSWYFLYHSLD